MDDQAIGLAEANTLGAMENDFDSATTAPYRIGRAIDFLGVSADLAAATLDFVIGKIDRHEVAPR